MYRCENRLNNVINGFIEKSLISRGNQKYVILFGGGGGRVDVGWGVQKSIFKKVLFGLILLILKSRNVLRGVEGRKVLRVERFGGFYVGEFWVGGVKV